MIRPSGFVMRVAQRLEFGAERDPDLRSTAQRADKVPLEAVTAIGVTQDQRRRIFVGQVTAPEAQRVLTIADPDTSANQGCISGFS